MSDEVDPRRAPAPVEVFKEHSGLTVVYSEVGRTAVWLTCPWCQTRVDAFLWSLAGSGKRCQCGALCGQIGAWKKP